VSPARRRALVTHVQQKLGVSTLLPANDDFVNAAIVSDSPYTVNDLDTTGATTQVNDPVLPCGPGNQGYRSVWYSFTPTSSTEYVPFNGPFV
jgi:hypothetical protein